MFTTNYIFMLIRRVSKTAISEYSELFHMLHTYY